MEPASLDLDSIDNLLKTLKDGPFFERKQAADELGRLPESHERVIAALMQAAESDSDPSVRHAAIQAMETPVHAHFMSTRPQMARAFTDIRQRNNRLEALAAQESDNQSLKSARQFLNGVRLLIVGVISLLTLMLDLPDALRWLLPAVMVVFIIAFFVRMFSQD